MPSDEEIIKMLADISANPDQVIADSEQYHQLIRQLVEYCEAEGISNEEFKAAFVRHRTEWEAWSLKDRIKYVRNDKTPSITPAETAHRNEVGSPFATPRMGSADRGHLVQLAMSKIQSSRA